MMHDTAHPLAGKTVLLKDFRHPDVSTTTPEFRLEDWWDRVSGGSWMTARGNPAALHYAARAGFANLPVDDDVVYGKIGYLGYLAHVSEIGEVLEPPKES